MRRLVVLALLLGLMALLQALQVGSDAPLNPLSLATFGFVLLAAYTLGQVTASAGLPKITGYIVTGLVFGPQVFNVFSGAVADDLRVVNDLAIGLIALGAGAEMQLGNLKKIARSLAAIIVIKGLLILIAITGSVWALARFIPFLADQPTGMILSVGMILGVLAIGTSPAATIAVISETGAKGRLADTTLGVAVGKDIVMVVLLALGIALVGTFSPGGHGFETEILTDLGRELALSLVAGAVLGGVIIAYLRYVGAELWLFLVAVIFAMTAVAQQLHLEALLTFIVGGFVVQNASTKGHDFVHLVETVALPVFVVFFSAAGAGIDLTALQAVGLVAVALVVVRLAAIWLGTKVATGLAGEPEEIRKNAWLAFVAQAGVVIGLVIIVEERLPGIGTEIRALVMGMVAIHLLVGPVLFKLALGRAGEIAHDRHPVDEAQEATAGWDVPAPELAPLAEELAWSANALSDHILLALDQLAEAAEKGPLRVAHTVEAEGVDHEDARQLLGRDWDEELDGALQHFLDEGERICLEAPKQVRVKLEEHWYRQARLDLGAERWRKRWRRLRRGLKRAVGGEPALYREVPLRDLFLYHVKHAFTEDLQSAVLTLAAEPALTVREALGYGLSRQPADRDPSEDHKSQSEQSFHHSEPADQLLRDVWEDRLRALRRDLTIAGTAELPAGRRRPSRMRDRSTRARERLREGVSAWRDLALSVVEHHERKGEIEGLRSDLAAALSEVAPEFHERLTEDVEAPLRRARHVLDQAMARLGELESVGWSELEDGLMQTSEWISSELRREALAGLRRDLESQPFEAVLRRLERRFDQLIDELPERYRVADPANLPDPKAPPRTYPRPAEYEFQLIARSLVERIVGSSFERAEEEAAAALVQAEQVVRTTRESLELRFEAALDSAMDERRDAAAKTDKSRSDRPRALVIAEAALKGSIEELDSAIKAAANSGREAAGVITTDVEALLDGLGVRLAGARPLGARIQAERARVELRGPTVLRLMGSRIRKRWNALLKRLGFVRERAGPGKDDAAGFVPLGPAGTAGSDRALLFRILFETTTTAGRVFDFLLIVTILASILVVMLDSVESVSASFGRTLALWEWFFTLAFTAEYVARLYAVDRPTRYALSFFGVIDLLAVIPTYLSLIVPGGQYLVSIRILRVLRVFRVFKLARYVGEAKVLGDALRASRYKITVFLVTVLTVTVVVGSVMFLVEGPEAGFTSIPVGVYWGIVTLTTVGFGDITPDTPLGQTLAAMLMILGYAIIAVPTGILSAEMARTPTGGAAVVEISCQTCGAVEDDPEAKFCRVCGTALSR